MNAQFSVLSPYTTRRTGRDVMTPMKFVVKYFSEIAIKSKPVRRRFVAQLARNLLEVLREIDPDIKVRRQWDKLGVETAVEDERTHHRMVEAMRHVSGITYILEVREHPLPALQDIVELVLPVYAAQLEVRSFAVRCKRTGSHDFTSIDVERQVGGALLARSGAAGVRLKNPDVTVGLEISKKTLFVIARRHRGLGGYPIGSLDPVLSLISGGFDSPVASYLTMRRGMRTHFLFFNLGGRDHEIGVKEVALYLWQKYGCNQRVLFISVPFGEVVAQLLEKVEDSQMGVILKRMMLRAATMTQPAHQGRIAPGHLHTIDAEIEIVRAAAVRVGALRNDQRPSDQWCWFARPAGLHRQFGQINIITAQHNFLA